MSSASLLQHALRTARVDGRDRRAQPALGAVVAATVLAIAGSLAADALLVALATRAFPSTRGYGHFHLGDYATLTVIGVLVAGVSWPVVVRVSWAPRWLYLRLAVLVTVVLWLPDLWLLARGQPLDAVGVLMAMHLAIAVLTYNLMVRLAPVRGPGPGEGPAEGPGDAAALGRPPAPEATGGAAARAGGPVVLRLAISLAALVGVEFLLGIGTLVVVPLGRPTGWLPAEGRAIYLAHAVLGLPLALGAAAFVVAAQASSRLSRVGGWVGLVGVAMAGAGGLVAVAHPLRLLGVGLMFVGPMVAAFGYLTPLFEAASAPPT
jgi:hypothetical protein